MRSGVVSGSRFNSRNTLDTIISQRKLPGELSATRYVPVVPDIQQPLTIINGPEDMIIISLIALERTLPHRSLGV